MLFRWDWLRPVLTAPVVPTLGPVHPHALTVDLFSATLVAAASQRHFLPYDKDRRWGTEKQEAILLDDVVHHPDHTLIPTLLSRGRGAVKGFCLRLPGRHPGPGCRARSQTRDRPQSILCPHRPATGPGDTASSWRPDPAPGLYGAALPRLCRPRPSTRRLAHPHPRHLHHLRPDHGGRRLRLPRRSDEGQRMRAGPCRRVGGVCCRCHWPHGDPSRSHGCRPTHAAVLRRAP